MRTGIEELFKERMEQQLKHGYTPETDKQYKNGELVSMAQYFLTEHNDAENENYEEYLFHDKDGPMLNQNLKHAYWAKDRYNRLIVAGALIAAEIDRIMKTVMDGPDENLPK